MLRVTWGDVQCDVTNSCWTDLRGQARVRAWVAGYARRNTTERNGVGGHSGGRRSQ